MIVSLQISYIHSQFINVLLTNTVYNTYSVDFEAFLTGHRHKHPADVSPANIVEDRDQPQRDNAECHSSSGVKQQQMWENEKEDKVLFMILI